MTLTTSSAADVDLYVLADAVKPEDRAAIGAARRPLLAVLNKADLIATTESGCHPHGPTTAARARCVRLSAHGRHLDTNRLVGILAVDGLDARPWSALRALADGHPVDARVAPAADGHPRRVRCRAGDRRDPAWGDPCRRRSLLLRNLSCIDEVVDKIEALGAPARYQRVLDAVAELETLAVTDRRISEFLSRDDTVVARMMAAVDVVEAVGMDVDRGDTAAAHLRRAVQWQRYRRGRVAATHRACGADIVRGSLRLWTQVGGAV